MSNKYICPKCGGTTWNYSGLIVEYQTLDDDPSKLLEITAYHDKDKPMIFCAECNTALNLDWKDIVNEQEGS